MSGKCLVTTMKKDYLLLAVPSPVSEVPEIVRATVPEGLSRMDLYLSILAHIPADAPQPQPLNLTDDRLANLLG